MDKCKGDCGGTCGQTGCPAMKKRKQSMMTMGYSEEAVDTILFGEKPGLWANIHAKRKRIKAGSGERMRKPGSKGAPDAKDLRDAGKDDD